MNRLPEIVHDKWDQVKFNESDRIGIIVSCEMVTLINDQTDWSRQRIQECTVKFADDSIKTVYAHQIEFNEQMYEGECVECSGEGTHEVMQECGRVASMCCGGCTETIQCSECNGTGQIEKPFDEIINIT